MHWIDDFLDSWMAVERTTDWRTAQPFSVDALDPYYYDIILQNLLNALEKLPKSIDPKALFVGPTNTRNTMVMSLFYSKFYGIGRDERMKIANFYNKILRSYSPKDPFCRKGTNRIYTEKTLRGIVKKTRWVAADGEAPRELGKLSASLAALVYSLYTDASPSLSGEFHGPYDVSKRFGRGHILFVRDYFDLKPIDLWEHAKKYRYKQVVVYAVYKNVKMWCDFYGNFTPNKDLKSNLAYYSVTADGKPLSGPKKIKALSEYIGGLTLQQMNRINKMNLEETKRKFMETESLQYKSVFRLAGFDWRPTPSMIKRIKNKRLIKGFGVWGQNRILTEKDLKYFRKIMDPRTELYYKPRVKIS